MPRPFTVTFDYLCPFARNAHEAVVSALRSGEEWDVRFLPFSLSQAHVEEGEPDVWDRPVDTPGTSGVRALTWSVAVRDASPEPFLAFHLALFAARHDQARNINEDAVLREAAAAAGLDPDAVAAEVDTGEPLTRLAAEHAEAVERWSVFGVPTFIDGDEAAFVRLMERGRVDDVRRVLDMLSWARLNEFKRTTIPR